METTSQASASGMRASYFKFKQLGFLLEAINFDQTHPPISAAACCFALHKSINGCQQHYTCIAILL